MRKCRNEEATKTRKEQRKETTQKSSEQEDTCSTCRKNCHNALIPTEVVYKNPLSFCLTTFGVIVLFSSLSFYNTLTNCNICNICSMHVCVHCVHVVRNLQA